MSILRSLLSAAAAYVPTEWVTGDIITADKLNHIESGISGLSGDVLTVKAEPNGEGTILNKTWNEIYTHMSNGGLVIIYLDEGIEGHPSLLFEFPVLISVGYEQAGQYKIFTISGQASGTFTSLYTCSDADGYPGNYPD